MSSSSSNPMIPTMAAKLEAALYGNSASLEEYSDCSDLTNRIAKLSQKLDSGTKVESSGEMQVDVADKPSTDGSSSSNSGSINVKAETVGGANEAKEVAEGEAAAAEAASVKDKAKNERATEKANKASGLKGSDGPMEVSTEPPAELKPPTPSPMPRERNGVKLTVAEMMPVGYDMPSQLTDDTEDIDDVQENEHFDSRQAFLNLCQGNHYQVRPHDGGFVSPMPDTCHWKL
jgi:hypothetical protein